MPLSLTKSLSVSVSQEHTEAIRACWIIVGMSEQCWVIYKNCNFSSMLALIPISQDGHPRDRPPSALYESGLRFCSSVQLLGYSLFIAATGHLASSEIATTHSEWYPSLRKQIPMLNAPFMLLSICCPINETVSFSLLVRSCKLIWSYWGHTETTDIVPPNLRKRTCKGKFLVCICQKTV